MTYLHFADDTNVRKITNFLFFNKKENLITHVDCGGLANLQVLLLGKNQLTNIHGLDDAENLQVLQLSHNSISRISEFSCGYFLDSVCILYFIVISQLF